MLQQSASALRSMVVVQRKTGLHFVYRRHSSKPVPGILAVASWWSSVTMRLIRVLVGILVVLLHQRRVVPALLWAWGQTVAILPRSFIMVVLVSRHQAASFNRRVICRCVIAVPVSLGLFERGNPDTDTVCLTFNKQLSRIYAVTQSEREYNTTSLSFFLFHKFTWMAAGYGERAVEPRLRPSKGLSGVLSEVCVARQ